AELHVLSANANMLAECGGVPARCGKHVFWVSAYSARWQQVDPHDRQVLLPAVRKPNGSVATTGWSGWSMVGLLWFVPLVFMSLYMSSGCVPVPVHVDMYMTVVGWDTTSHRESGEDWREDAVLVAGDLAIMRINLHAIEQNRNQVAQ